MSRTVYVDVIGGAAGDMLLAALLDAGAPLDSVQDAVDAVLPGRFRISTERVLRADVWARFLRLEEIEETPFPQGPRPFADLRARVQGGSLPPRVRESALAVLDRLGRAEAGVHGVGMDDLILHEVGDDDTLLDVVGVAAALDALGALDSPLLVSSIPLAAGATVSTAEGELPVPTPVTLELLRGFVIRGEGSGETVTPTGAAILSALGRPGPQLPAMVLETVGYGAGARDPADRPNVVRVLVGAPQASAGRGALETLGERDLLVLEANLDDLSPELVADAARALLSAGALDVWTVPIQMKKGRPAVMLAALCEPERSQAMTRVFLEATSTFGVRSHRVGRAELERRSVRVDLPDGSGSVRVKVGFLGDRPITVKPEHDDVAEVAARTGRPIRWVHEEAVSAARQLRYQSAWESP